MSKEAFDKVKLARSNSRPTGLDYIEHIFGNFFELHGDRAFGDDKAVVGGVAFLNDLPVTVIATEKGHTAKERTMRNFGAPHPEGYRKALRLMKQAEKFRRPVICFVDTSGAYCGIGAEERGQGQAIAANMMEMITLKTPIVSVLIGEGGSGGALALAVADQVWMLENAVYSVISPEGCASILWKDSSRAAEAAKYLKLTAEDALSMSVIEKIIPEKHLGEETFYEELKSELTRQIILLGSIPTDELVNKRRKRFRSIGISCISEETVRQYASESMSTPKENTT